jgi:hypothetical protein
LHQNKTNVAAGKASSSEQVQRVTKKHLFRSANAAKECDHVGFVVVDSTFEGSATITAKRRVSGEKNVMQKQIKRYCIAQASRSRVSFC